MIWFWLAIIAATFFVENIACKGALLFLGVVVSVYILYVQYVMEIWGESVRTLTPAERVLERTRKAREATRHSVRVDDPKWE